MKALYSSVGAACMLLASSLSQGATLLEIYQTALDNDPELAAARQALEAGMESRKIGRAALLPQIGGSASYSESETDSIRSGPQVFGGEVFPDSLEDSTSEGESTSYSVSLRQPLFDMSAWYSYKQGGVQTKAAIVQFSADQQDFIVRVATAYFDVLRAIDNLRTALAELEALESQLEQTRQRYEVGLTAITDVHEVQARYDSAIATTVSARGNLAIFYEALEVLTGQSYDSVAPISEEFPVTDPVPADRSAWVEFALENNYSLQSALLNAELSKLTAKSRRSAHLPTLGATLSYSDSDSHSETEGVSDSINRITGIREINHYDTFNDSERNGTSISLDLNIPIYSGGRISAQRRQAYHQSLQAEDLYNLTRRRTIQLARSSHLAVETGVVRVDALRQAITSSQSALDAAQAGYEVGTRTLVDVLLQQQALFQAQFSYYDSLYNYILNTLRLKQAAGTLSPEDVVELNQWLEEAEQVSPADLEQ